MSRADIRQRHPATEDEAGNFQGRTPELRSLYTYDAQGNLVEASENGTDYHYTHDTEGRVLSKRAWGKTLYENHYDACGRLRELITGERSGKSSCRWRLQKRLALSSGTTTSMFSVSTPQQTIEETFSTCLGGSFSFCLHTGLKKTRVCASRKPFP